MREPFTAELVVEGCLSGRRIDTFLSRHFRNYSSYRMERLARAGQVRVDGLPAEWNQRVFKGQRVQVRLIEPPDVGVEPEPLPLDIIHEDAWLLVVNKPPGQTSHPAGSYQSGTLLNAVQHHLDQQTPMKGLLRPGIVHRLDRQTSGLMIVPKEHLTHRRLTIQFERRKVFKSYLALTHGVVPEDYVFVDLPIGVWRESGLRLMSARPEAHKPQSAATEVTVLERFDAHTLVSARPLTGRLHQIRVHLSAIGFPIAGDEFYGVDASNEYGTGSDQDVQGLSRLPANIQDVECRSHFPTPMQGDEERLIHRQALHAHQLCFRHPITEEFLAFEAPVPQDMQTALEQLRQRRNTISPPAVNF